VTDFLLELASEEIPARMQATAAEPLRTRFIDGCKAAGLTHGEVVADATPRRLWLIARDVAAASEAATEERKGPAATAPEAAIAGFLRGVGLGRDQLEERQTPKGVVLFAHIRSEGRPAATILAELAPLIVNKFDWPKSMRWGAASATTASPRWVRPLTGIVALLGDEIVPCEAHGITSGRTTRGHRVHAPEPIFITSAATYAEQLRAGHVIVSSAERRAIIETGAAEVAAAAGLSVIPDAGLVAENAGLTEWPVPLLGRFDPAFLAVPREVIQLTMRTNQKYFALADGTGSLSPAFICIANLVADDGGAAIVRGNERVLSARLSDARFFCDQDAAVVNAGGLEAFLPKLETIVFHEKLGTIADKVRRMEKLARWLVESRVVTSFPQGEASGLADLAELAAKLCKADLVSATVGEFPEVQGIISAYLAGVTVLDRRVAAAIRDHYKPAGQGDDVPTAPVSVAVALADKLDTIVGFFSEGLKPTGSGDPFALRRAALGVLLLIQRSGLRVSLGQLLLAAAYEHHARLNAAQGGRLAQTIYFGLADALGAEPDPEVFADALATRAAAFENIAVQSVTQTHAAVREVSRFFIDRLKVQQRDAGVRHDLIDAIFALGGEDDLVRLLARVHALQAFIATDDGANLLAGYKRAANILKIETGKDGAILTPDPSRKREGSEAALALALDTALPAAAAAVAAEDFTAAMTALASLRAPVDAFFTDVMVNDPDPAVRQDRLALLARFRDAVHQVADFSRIEG